MKNCVICNKELTKNPFKTKDKFELWNHSFICRTCASKIGINNIFSASSYTKEKVRKKYLQMFPEERIQKSNLWKENEETGSSKGNTGNSLRDALLIHNNKSSAKAMDLIDKMEGHDFEQYCADILRKNGFTNVSVTKGSGDQGIDILAIKDDIKYGIQCKCYSSDLGNKPVQEALAGKIIYNCHVAAVLTNRYFTQGAKDAAKSTGVILWDRKKLQAFIDNAENN